MLKLSADSDNKSNSSIQWIIHNLKEEPASVTNDNGKPVEYSWDADNNILVLKKKVPQNTEVNILL